MNLLTDYNFKFGYDTSNDNLVKDFFVPAFLASKLYKRGVGYFTSGWLYYNARGIAFLLKNGGKVKFITSPNIDENDLIYLKGEFDQKIIENIILKNIDEIENQLKKEYKNFLGWLVYDGIIEFKFAIPKPHILGGEFHDKFGIFIDSENNLLAFNGSINDSIKGYHNYEYISVFPSWRDDTCFNFAYNLNNRFDKLWCDKDPNLKIYTLNTILKDKLINFRNSDNELERPYNIEMYKNNNKIKKYISIPSEIKIRSYQKEALESWVNNNGKGILSMATGSGKTITALSLVVKMTESIRKLVVIVVVPYKHLLEQWAAEGEKFNINFLKCDSDYHNWVSELNEELNYYYLNPNSFLAIITTNDTFKNNKFQGIISNIKDFFIIVDEVHNWGSLEIRNKYPDNAKYRLGLSATPKRYFDEEGTNSIIQYFGDIIYEYTLKDAIEHGNLCRYYYYPILVNLTEEEFEDYCIITQEIADLIIKMKIKSNNITELIKKDEKLKMKFLKRSKIIAVAENKIIKLKEILRKNNLFKSQLNLFYVAAKIERNSDENIIKYVDRIVNELTQIGMFVKKFTADEDKFYRAYLIEQLKKKVIDGLVAIKCLDEGIDIPSIERAFILASSTNPKEFIQRRGRILRKAPNKEYAYIYDFIVVPNIKYLSNNKNIYTIERDYLAKELRRFSEFASLSENKYEAEEILKDFKKKYDLIHI